MANIERTIMALAAQHGGALTRQMLLDRGISRSSIQRRVNSGLLVPVIGGACAVQELRSDLTALHAAVLAYPSAAAARHTAAHLHGLPVRLDPLRLVVPHGSSHRIDGLIVHETRNLPNDDVTMMNNLRMTTVARSLCDMSSSESDRWLRHLCEVALTQRLTCPVDLKACASERFRRRAPGMARMMPMLGDVLDDEPIPESVVELLLFRTLESLGVQNITRQWMPPWYDGRRGIVDGRDELSPTILELDGRGFRQITQAHDNDRTRDRIAAKHGFLVVRIGALELKRAPNRVGGEVKEILESRRADSAHHAA